MTLIEHFTRMTDDTTKLAARIWVLTKGEPWEPPFPKSRQVAALIGSGYVERCDMRCGFEAMKDAGLKWTEAGKVAMRALETQAAEIARLRGLLGEADEAIDHLTNVLFADPGPKLQASVRAATEWWNARDMATLAKLRAETGGGEDEEPCDNCGRPANDPECECGYDASDYSGE